MKVSFLMLLLCGFIQVANAQSSAYTISSPNKNIVATCDAGRSVYTVSYKGQSVLKDSKLGIIREITLKKNDGFWQCLNNVRD